MDRFIGFLLRRWLVAALVVLAVASATLGYVQQGAQLWDYGPPGWAFQLGGFLLFAGVVTYLIYDWDQKMQGAQPEPVARDPEVAAEDRERAKFNDATRNITRALTGPPY